MTQAQFVAAGDDRYHEQRGLGIGHLLIHDTEGMRAMKIDDGKYDSAGRVRNGPFEQRFKDGALACAGQHENGEKTGAWKYYLLNGQVKAAGRFAHDQMTGEWIWHRENGELMQTGAFEDGQRVGVWRRYHPNGTLQDEGEYAGEVKVGDWRTYGPDGTLMKTTHHKPAIGRAADDPGRLA